MVPSLLFAAVETDPTKQGLPVGNLALVIGTLVVLAGIGTVWLGLSIVFKAKRIEHADAMKQAGTAGIGWCIIAFGMFVNIATIASGVITYYQLNQAN